MFVNYSCILPSYLYDINLKLWMLHFY